ncbi:hypothetical protein GOBAR_DD33206 [Gossypium barbadense]|nr:hypothetical protein GOBAR_DD33206 [Gossypium barbadense]
MARTQASLTEGALVSMQLRNPLVVNGTEKKLPNEIELLYTKMLVERAFDTSHPDLVELEKAKKKLKEQALINAIVRLADASDGESGNQYVYT